MASGKKSKSTGGKIEKKVTSRSEKAGLAFPVGRIARLLKNGNYAQRIGSGAPVYLAAVLEYLCAEVLELSGNAAHDNKKHRITARFIQLAVRNDEELNELLKGVVIAEGGVLPQIHNEILLKKTKHKTLGMKWGSSAQRGHFGAPRTPKTKSRCSKTSFEPRNNDIPVHIGEDVANARQNRSE
ncbi:hypothetical protein QR680_018122 [Steinernema hermaphroditum]|uniref:Histone H2A n=1 Tax=Steinernema hermaphroditum TaxID=289476 RepID=A0AA39LQ82_9BILA|nr:hypothetical protein QR680_018122 [Steinernema hermaphroditum]